MGLLEEQLKNGIQLSVSYLLSVILIDLAVEARRFYMFCLHTMIYNIRRYKYKSITTICICIFVILLLNLYLGNINSSKRQLESLPSVIPVYCRITNLNGSQEAGLEIAEELILNLQSSSYVKDAAYTVRLMAGVGDFTLQDWKQNLTLSVVGTNTIAAIPGLTWQQVQMEDDMDSDFFDSSVAVCIVSKRLMEKEQWKLGDTIPVNLFYYSHDGQYELNCSQLELLPIKIVGKMEAIVSTTEQLPPDIIVPFNAIRESYHRKGVSFFADSAFFYVADPLKLNEFKKEMKSFGLLSKVPAADYSYQGNALMVRDTTFLLLASQLQQGIHTLISFFPVVCVTVIAIGYITSFLLINSRQKEHALMRALGTSRSRCFMVFFAEQLTLVLCGEIIGGFVAFVFFREGSVEVAVGILFLISYLLGDTIALWRIGRKSVMESFFQVD